VGRTIEYLLLHMEDEPDHFIPVIKRPYPLCVINCDPGAALSFLIRVDSPFRLGPRDALISYTCSDDSGELDVPIKNKRLSPLSGVGYYEYLTPGPPRVPRCLSIIAPERCTKVKLNLWPWSKRPTVADLRVGNTIVLCRGWKQQPTIDEAIVLFDRITASAAKVGAEPAEKPAAYEDDRQVSPAGARKTVTGLPASVTANAEVARLDALTASSLLETIKLLREYETLVDPGTRISLGLSEENTVLTERPIALQVQVAPESRIAIYVEFLPDNAPVDPRESLVIIKFFDKSGRRLEGPYAGLHASAALGSFRYLDLSPSTPNIATTTFDVPAEAVSVELAIRKWRSSRSLRVANAIRLVNLAKLQQVRRVRKEFEAISSYQHSTKAGEPNTLPAVRADTGPLRAARDIRVAMICDEFSYESFAPECTPVVLEPTNWRAKFEEHSPDFFFCESAWSGNDSKRRPWKGKVYASVNFKNENRRDLLEIISYCKKRGIPTVFFNKEDPTHFADLKHNFAKTAQLFDTVITTAEECVERYRVEYGCKQVVCMPFATQPRHFNPIEKYSRSRNVVFAGSWYANHVERSADMTKMFDAVITSGLTLEIYDRYFGDPDPNHFYPDKYSSFTKPSVAFTEIDRVYKSSIYGLNINTVIDSPTMFARRVFELMSSNTLVVSNYSKGVERMFGDVVVLGDRTPFRLGDMSEAEVNVRRDAALHRVLAEHTYRHRFGDVLQAIGVTTKDSTPSLTLVAPVHSRDDAIAACRIFEKQREGLGDCRLLLYVGSDVSDIDVPQFYQEFNRFGVAVTSSVYVQRYAGEKYRPIETSHFAVIGLKQVLADQVILRASRHLEYAFDQVIQFGSAEKYRVSRKRVENNFIAPARRFAEIALRGPEGPMIDVYHV
jgi:spore maturation protein CgeB